MKTYAGVAPVFLTSAVHGSKRQLHIPATLPHRNSFQYPRHRRLAGFHSRSGGSIDEKNLSSLPRIKLNSSVVQPVSPVSTFTELNKIISSHFSIILSKLFNTLNYRNAWNSGKALNSHLADTWFESRLGHRIS